MPVGCDIATHKAELIIFLYKHILIVICSSYTIAELFANTNHFVNLLKNYRSYFLIYIQYIYIVM